MFDGCRQVTPAMVHCFKPDGESNRLIKTAYTDYGIYQPCKRCYFAEKCPHQVKAEESDQTPVQGTDNKKYGNNDIQNFHTLTFFLFLTHSTYQDSDRYFS